MNSTKHEREILNFFDNNNLVGMQPYAEVKASITLVKFCQRQEGIAAVQYSIKPVWVVLGKK